MDSTLTLPPPVKKKISKSLGNVHPRFIMLGGFLGAGKTTTLLRLALSLQRKGLRVGLITNDQGRELVDTAMLRSLGFATEEISGGCFCCRFNSLVEAADKLTEASAPDVIIAEPVGSCTDLVAAARTGTGCGVPCPVMCPRCAMTSAGSGALPAG